MDRRLMPRRFASTFIFVFLLADVLPRLGAAEISSRVYVDSRHGFSLRYSDDAVVTTGDGNAYPSQIYNTMIDTPAIVVRLNPASFKGTNLASGGVSVSVSNDSGVMHACGTGKAVSDEEPASGVKLDDVPFARFEGGDGGAGTIWNWTMYRAVHGDSCYEIVEWLSSAAFYDFPAGTVKEFDRKRVESQLRAITQSFRFLK